MARLITVADKVYEDLSRIKGRRSFSDVIRSLLGKKGGSIMEVAGILKGSDVSAWKRLIEEDRKRNLGRKIKAL